MQICHHNIKKSEIVGIGPLMTKQSADQVTRQLYDARQIFFYLHLRNVSILIESDWYSTTGLPDASLKEHRVAYKAWAAEYYKALQAVQELIGEGETVSEIEK